METIQRARAAGTTIPLDSVPIPKAMKKELAGKSALSIINEAAPLCAQYLMNCIILKRFKPSWARIDVAKYVVDQAIGKAKIRAEITGAGGAPLSWLGVVNLFAQVEDAERLARLGKPLPELPHVVDVEVKTPGPTTSPTPGNGDTEEKEEAPATETAEAL